MNIILNSYCNLKCNYCFADEYMEETVKTPGKSMDYDYFQNEFLPKIKMHVRAMLDKHGRIEFVPIKATEGKWILVRLDNKSTSLSQGTATSHDRA